MKAVKNWILVSSLKRKHSESLVMFVEKYVHRLIKTKLNLDKIDKGIAKSSTVMVGETQKSQ